MMEYRKLPHGTETISTLGLGTGGIHNSSPEEIQAVIESATEHGINFFDLCAGGKNVYQPFGKAIKGKRDKIYFQLHFGAVYKPNGEYGWSRNFKTIKDMFEWELKALGTDYVDFGFLHCVDEKSDFGDIKKNGIFDYVKGLKADGIVKPYRFFFAHAERGKRVARYGRYGYDDVFDKSRLRSGMRRRIRNRNDKRASRSVPTLRKRRSRNIGYEALPRRAAFKR